MISAVWITKNEEGKLGRSINSVKDVADELIVVDTGSTDRTIEEAREYGARVEHFTWVNDFAAARNYALSLAKGDALIVLDADEWFEPALNADFVKEVNEEFLPNDHATFLFELINIDPDYGIELGRATLNRVLNRNRFKNGEYYTGAVHETLALPMEKRQSIWYKNTFVMHDGYGIEVSQAKTERNIALLKQEFEQIQEDNEQKVKLGVYLSREYTLRDIHKAVAYTRWCMDRPALLERVLRQTEDLLGAFVLVGMTQLEEMREVASRLQIKNTLVAMMKKLGADRAAALLIDALYTRRFDFKTPELADTLLPLLDATEAARAKDSTHAKEYQDTAQALCVAGGRACYRLGDRPKMFEITSRALSYKTLSMGGELISQFLLSVKGLPVQDIILFLNSKLNLTARSTFDVLCNAVQYEGNKQLYLYYTLKAVEGGMATKADYYYFLTVSGKAEDAIHAALKAADSLEEDVLQRVLFLALASAQDAVLLEKYAAQTGRYLPLLQGVFKGTAPGEESYALVEENYFLLAFAAGLPLANGLLDLYEGKARENFYLRLGYYYYSGMCAEFLDSYPYTPKAGDLPAFLSLADACCAAGRYQEAWKWLKAAFDTNGPAPDWFNLAAVVMRKAEGEAKTEAETYYERYFKPYEECIDLRDLVNTGREMPTVSKKQQKKLGGLPGEILQKWMRPETEKPFVNQLLLYQKAAALLARQGNMPEAVRLYTRVLAYPDAVCAYGPAHTLQGWFLQLKNKEAAAILEKMAAEAKRQTEEALAARLAGLEGQSSEVILEGQKRALAALPPEALQMVEQEWANGASAEKLCWKDGEFGLLESRAKALGEGLEELRWLAGRLAGPADRQVLAAVLENWQTLAPRALSMASETWQPAYCELGKVLEIIPEKLQDAAFVKRLQSQKPTLVLPLSQASEDVWRIPRRLEEICVGYSFHLLYFGGRWAPVGLALAATHKEAAKGWAEEAWPQGNITDYIAPPFGTVIV